MLTDDQRQRIEADAIAKVRQQWGHTSPERLSDIVAEIRTSMAEGSWGQQSLADRVVELARLAHAKDVFSRDAAQERAIDTERKGPALGD